MVNRFDNTGCGIGSNAHGEFVTSEDYDELERRHDAFVKDVRTALTELENSPEVNERSRAEEVIGLNDAVDAAINLLMSALDKGRA